MLEVDILLLTDFNVNNMIIILKDAEVSSLSSVLLGILFPIEYNCSLLSYGFLGSENKVVFLWQMVKLK